MKAGVTVNAITCPKCSCTIYSRHVHDFHYCECGAVAINGGFDYTKIAFGDFEPPKPFPLFIENITKAALAHDWATKVDKYGIIYKPIKKKEVKVVETTKEDTYAGAVKVKNFKPKAPDKYHEYIKVQGERVLLIRSGNKVIIKNTNNDGSKPVVGKDYGVARCNQAVGDEFHLGTGIWIAYNRMKRVQLRRRIRKDARELSHVQAVIMKNLSEEKFEHTKKKIMEQIKQRAILDNKLVMEAINVGKP